MVKLSNVLGYIWFCPVGFIQLVVASATLLWLATTLGDRATVFRSFSDHARPLRDPSYCFLFGHRVPGSIFDISIRPSSDLYSTYWPSEDPYSIAQRPSKSFRHLIDENDLFDLLLVNVLFTLFRSRVTLLLAAFHLLAKRP